MAMIVDAMASQFADTLSSLIKDEITMMVTVKEDLKKLERKVRMIHKVLEDAERKAIRDDAVRTWLKELRDAFYDADDIIDDSRTQAERMTRLFANQQVRCWTPLVSIYRRLLFLHRIGGRIRSLNARLEDIFKEKSDFDLSLNVSKGDNESNRIRRDSDPDVEPDIVGFGIEKSTNDLVRMMISSNSKTISVYGIVGMGGIGKTTLAQMINNHKTIRDNFQFPAPMWVSVSKDYYDEKLLKSIIKHAGGNSGDASNTGELQNILHQTVLHKKIFLVLDDIWDANIWEKLLRKPLLNAGAGSILLITSRDEGVARGMDAVHLHSVQPLSDSDGWSLLCKIVFRAGGEEHEMQLLEPLGKQIVHKCNGHPLAIKTIAGVLHAKEKRHNAWNMVLQNPAWSMTELPEGVMGVLYLSYEDLQPQLKQCFIFCSLLPEDYVIMRHLLIQYWVASGFVKERDNMIMEDVAREYYKELLRRNLLQIDPYTYRNGGCTMHDLLRDLAQFIAQGEYFSGEVATLAKTSLASQEMKLRHLSISGDFLETSPEIVKKQTSVRTLIIFVILTNTLPEDLFQKLKCLRLLDFGGTNLKVVPESISSLVHLRYLDFSDSMIQRLPETIGNLSNLQYLILQDCEQLSELPTSIANLYKLRTIDLLGTQVIGIPVGIGQLIHLNRVMDFVTNDQTTDGAGECYSSLEDLKPLINLRNITIVNLERAARAQGSILKDKTHIDYLELSCSSEGWPYQQEDVARIQYVFEERLCPPSSVENFKIRGYFGMEFPTWMKNRDLFLNLTRLDILKCRNCSQLPPLGQLPLLDYLYIKGAWSMKHIGPEFMGSGREEVAFPKLKRLWLKDMREWEEWTWEATKDGARRVMPILESLKIKKCPRLKSLPQGLLRHATNLTTLWIEESHSLTAIEGFKSVQEAFLLRNNGVERVSDLPAVQTMAIEDCPALLLHIGVLPSLQNLYWQDSSMRFLRDWMLPHPIPIFPTLQKMSIFVSDVPTLRRCLKDGPDWPKIQHIPNVSIEVIDGPEFISYTKEPFSFLTNSFLTNIQVLLLVMSMITTILNDLKYYKVVAFLIQIKDLCACVCVCVDNPVMLLLVLSFCCQGD